MESAWQSVTGQAVSGYVLKGSEMADEVATGEGGTMATCSVCGGIHVAGARDEEEHKELNGAFVLGDYRYTLWRQAAGKPAVPWVLWVMLNPSTADASVDDPTIRKVRGFSERWGFGRFVVVNLYALRSTDPKALWSHPAPVGPSNDWVISQLITQGPGAIICAWGAHAKRERVDEVTTLIYIRSNGIPVQSLGLTKSGMPKHPLMLSYDTEREPFR